MAFKPILLSNAEVIHQSMFKELAIEIHSSVPLHPPTKLGFKMMYWGWIFFNKATFSDASKTPINSSSKATCTCPRLITFFN